MFRFFLLFSVLFLNIFPSSGRYRMISDPDEPLIDFLNADLPLLSDSSLIVKEKSSNELGIYANTSISKDSIILTLPLGGITASFDDYIRSYFFCEMARTDHKELLLGRLLMTKHLKQYGYLYDYYLRTPYEPHINNSFLLWSQQDYDYFLQHAGFIDDDTMSRSSIERNLKNIREINEPFREQYQPHFPAEMFEQHEMLWAMSLINDKAYEFSKEEYCLLNGLDPATYQRTLPNMKLSDEHKEKFGSKGVALIAYFDIFGREEVIIELPQMVQLKQSKELLEKFGFLNENFIVIDDSFTGQNGFDFFIDSIEPKSFRDYWVIENGTLKLKANRDYQINEEITYFNGYISNNKLLREHGYISDTNFFTGVRIPVNLQGFSEEERNYMKSMEISRNSDNFTVFNFHEFQINHKFVNFLRIFIMKQEELMPVFNETKHISIIKNGRFKNAYLESLLWFNYVVTIDSRHTFQTSILQDRRELKEEIDNGNKLRAMMLKVAIHEKFVIYKHVFGGWSKFVKLLHNDINLGFIKKAVLSILIEPGSMYQYSERD